jgi:hypothetical protein
MRWIVVGILAAAVAAGALSFAEVPSAAINPSPRQAARETKACFVRHGWSVKLSEAGATVDAQSPRNIKAPVLPIRPWYSVSFFVRCSVLLGRDTPQRRCF